MDLFENPLNENGKYERPEEVQPLEIVIPELEEVQVEEPLEDDGALDVSVLPSNAIEVSIYLIPIHEK